MKGNVGELRQQSALSGATRPVILVSEDSEDKELQQLLAQLEVVGCYPDTVDAEGNFNSTFKIAVQRKK